MKSKNLILLTDEFPYGSGEQFLETEIKILSEHFDEILIYPFRKRKEKRSLPNNAEVIELKRDLAFSPRKTILRNWSVILKVFITEFTRRKLYKAKGYKYHFNKLVEDLNNAEIIHTHLRNKKGYKIYSYWFGKWGNLMTLINVLSKKKIAFVTRVHGFDYDVDRWSNKLIPFRRFQMKHVKEVFPVSEFAVKRLRKEYPKNFNVSLQRLGVNDYGDNPFKEDGVYRIVSCSSLIDLKRVHLIVEILKHIKTDVSWVHFGSGPLQGQIESQIKTLPNNIITELKGHVQNSEIIEYYKNNAVDIFINVSELEGVPVSLMEAISFGIPILGCDICGVPEIVTNETGVLIEKDFNPKDVAKILGIVYSANSEQKINKRKQAKLFWKENYCAETNYTKFIKEKLLV